MSLAVGEAEVYLLIENTEKVPKNTKNVVKKTLPMMRVNEEEKTEVEVESVARNINLKTNDNFCFC